MKNALFGLLHEMKQQYEILMSKLLRMMILRNISKTSTKGLVLHGYETAVDNLKNNQWHLTRRGNSQR